MSRQSLVLVAVLTPALALADAAVDAPNPPSPSVETTPAPETPAPAAAKWFVHVNAGMPLYTSVGAWQNPLGKQVAAASFSSADRMGLVQLVGAGRWMTPWLRLNLSLQFAELVTSQAVTAPAGAHTYTGLAFTSAIVWAAFTFGPAFFGVGPMVGARWMGNSMKNWVYADGGIFTCAGISLKLGYGFLFGLALQVPITFNPAVNVGVVPAVLLANRF